MKYSKVLFLMMVIFFLTTTVSAQFKNWSQLISFNGGYIFTDEKIFINAAYNFSYMSNSFYRDGIIHLLKIGIGFQSI